MSLVKKIFIISGSLFLMLVFLWGIYKAAFEKKPTPSATTAIAPPEKSSPVAETSAQEEIPQGRLYAVTDEAVIAPTLTSDADFIKYYTKSTGNVFQTDLDGRNKRLLASEKLLGLTGILWSPDKDQVISRFTAPNKSPFAYYNYLDKKSASLNKNIVNAVWQNNNRIIYFYFDKTSNTKNLTVANPDGTNWKKLADVTFDNIFLAPVSQNGEVAFWNVPDAYTESILQTVSVLENTPPKTIFSGKFGATYLWSPDGSQILVSHTNDKGGSKTELALLNANGENYQTLNIPTFVAKCAWSGNEDIFYALPVSIPEDTVLPNDYFANKFKTTDSFWSFNIASGKKTRLIELNELKDLPQVDAINLFLDPNGSALFFTNRNDGKLYRLDL